MNNIGNINMAKKNFSGGIDSLFQRNEHEQKKEPDDKNKSIETESARTTIIVNVSTYEKIKAIAFWERKTIKEIIEKSFTLYLNQYTSEELTQMVESLKKSSL